MRPKTLRAQRPDRCLAVSCERPATVQPLDEVREVQMRTDQSEVVNGYRVELGSGPINFGGFSSVSKSDSRFGGRSLP